MDGSVFPTDENTAKNSDEQLFDQLEKIKAESLQPLNEAQSQSVHARSLDSHALKTVLLTARKAIDDALLLITGSSPSLHEAPRISTPAVQPPSAEGGAVIEGVFDGQGMLGVDGKHYTMSPNYASKSKLVAGDHLKLTIGENGMLMYKQTLPVQRRRLLGILEYDAVAKAYSVAADSSNWRVLTASVTYHKGAPGDSVALVVPQEGSSTWAAVEHIIKRT